MYEDSLCCCVVVVCTSKFANLQCYIYRSYIMCVNRDSSTVYVSRNFPDSSCVPV